MNALIHNVEQTGTALRLPQLSKQLRESVTLAGLLVIGFAVASLLALLEGAAGTAEAGRILAALAGTTAWVYLGLAIDEDRFVDAIPDVLAFVAILALALLSLGGNPQFTAAAFAVHLLRALMRLHTDSEDASTRYGLMLWAGLTLAAALVCLAVAA